MEALSQDQQDFDQWESEFLDVEKHRKKGLGIAGINFKMLSNVMGRAAFMTAAPELVPVQAEPEMTTEIQPEAEDDNLESVVVLRETGF